MSTMNEIKAVPMIDASAMHRNPGHSIGAILVDAGRLRIEDADVIMRLQREKGLRFGEAAKQLGLLTEADIDFALARQFRYPYVIRGSSTLDEEIVAAYTPAAPEVEALRALRSQLMLRWFAPDVKNKTLAIVSTERNEGRSWLAANLAVVFSQLGERTLLIDADLRHPRQHTLFGIGNVAGLSVILSGRGSLDAVQAIPDLPGLSVLPAGALPPNPQELLGGEQFASLLDHLYGLFDVVIVDTPSMTETADAQVVAARAGGALVVARKNVSRASRLRESVNLLAQGNTQIVGCVMNEH
jgi:protein-tyrosine kinase